jgi:hypothetical protein
MRVPSARRWASWSGSAPLKPWPRRHRTSRRTGSHRAPQPNTLNTESPGVVSQRDLYNANKEWPVQGLAAGSPNAALPSSGGERRTCDRFASQHSGRMRSFQGGF